MKHVICALAASTLLLVSCGEGASGGGGTRTQIRAVGSSTVYPFTTAVAEQFNRKNGNFKAPIVESTGTGAGFKLFCGGVGAQHPDVANASRRIKASELADCRSKEVNRIVELQIGIDGIAFAQSPTAPQIALTKKDVYEALAAMPYGQPQAKRSWKEVNPALPDIPILVYGPPPTSGTRDALAELIMAAGCETNPEMRALKERDADAHQNICTKVREDPGVFVESGENDNLIAQKVIVNPGAIGIFGYSFLAENGDRLRGIPVNGVVPSNETITSSRYPGARALYIYVKGEHIGVIPGLKEFIGEYATALAPDTYLMRRGLIPAPDAVRTQVAQIAANLTPLNPAGIE